MRGPLADALEGRGRLRIAARRAEAVSLLLYLLQRGPVALHGADDLAPLFSPWTDPRARVTVDFTGAGDLAARAWARPQVIWPTSRLAVPLPRAHFALFSGAGALSLERLGVEADKHLYLRERVRGGVRLSV